MISFIFIILQAVCQVISSLHPDSLPSSSVDDSELATVFRYRQQQSVNLGSWFVQEQWMVPSLFKCAAEPKQAEIDIANGGCNPQTILEQHWDTFITQEDFQYLASIGINTVRLPIGYWSLPSLFLDGTPFENFASIYENAWAYVTRAINMAAEAGIGVLLDLHGAVGSQNGQPHSGVSDGITNLFTNRTYQDKTLLILEFLAQQLCSVPNIVGIQILNEPEDCPVLADFYTRAINAMINATQTTCSDQSFPLYIHDAFDFNRFANFVSDQIPKFIVQDHHSYFVYTPEDNAEAAHDHTQDVWTKGKTQLTSPNDTSIHNLIIGEWSCALTPNSLSNEKHPQEAQRDFGVAQYDVYSNTTPGNYFWSYRKEDCDPGWCFLDAVGDTLPETFFSYDYGPFNPDQLDSIDRLQPKMPALSDVPFQRRHSTESTYRYPSRAITYRRQIAAPVIPETSGYQDGYRKGYTTAQKFASVGPKLGFVGQFLLTGDGGAPICSQGMEQGPCTQGFMQGLKDAEKDISSLL